MDVRCFRFGRPVSLPAKRDPTCVGLYRSPRWAQRLRLGFRGDRLVALTDLGRALVRHREAERRPLGGRFDLDAAGVGFGDFGDDVQAEAEAIVPAALAAAEIGLE